MSTFETVCLCITEIAPLLATVCAFIYGVRNFFKKGKALYLQIVTMAMGCYAMANFYHICQVLVVKELTDGFTPAYLGKIGFYMFLFTANFGQIDGLLDDKSPALRKGRWLGLIAPLLVLAMFFPCLVSEMTVGSIISYVLVWVCALASSYYNCKHIFIRDLGYGFVKAIRPYNIGATILTLLDIGIMVLWAYYDIPVCAFVLTILAIAFSITSIFTIVNLKKGVESWTI